MLINEEDKIQYNLIEDVFNEKVIGSVENIKEWVKDNIKYNIENGDDVEQLNEFLDALKEEDANEIIVMFDNPMIGLDWQHIEYR